MGHQRISRARLRHQYLASPLAGTAMDLVSWMGAVQAQEYEHARWGVGLRLAGGKCADDVEGEIAAGRILRTHVLRPTWHFVAAGDLRWMQALTAPRVHLRMAPYNRHLALDAKTLTRATALIERAVGDGHCLTRAELGQVLARARIAITPVRLAHIAMHAELECVICSGPRRERQSTYALVSARAPQQDLPSRDESLGELARRYFQSHGPATIRDFVWWSGLRTADARRAAGIARASSIRLEGREYWAIEFDDRAATRSRSTTSVVHLLPIYDEYLVAYQDRDVVPHGPRKIVRNGRAVGFQHALVIGGQVAGTWRTDARAAGAIDVTPMRRLTASERQAVVAASRRYARFVR